MIVKWTTAAEQDRNDIWDYIARDNPVAAARMDELFDQAGTRLSTMPNRGRRGKLSGTRELMPHKNYRLVYEIVQDTVWIIALIHTARRWPP